MIKYIFIGLSFLCLLNITVHADPVSTSQSQHKEEIGFGLGALIGGLIAGPAGAVIGAAGGSWFGNKGDEKDVRISGLEKRITEKQTESAALQKELSNLQSLDLQALQKVKLDSRFSTLEALSRGVSLTVYFRTNSADIDAEIITRLERLADYLQHFPEIQLYLEAHADRRGNTLYNKQLSQQRAHTVKRILIEAGLDRHRIHPYAHGESQALAAEGDQEGYVFDRRVSIQLTLNSEV